MELEHKETYKTILTNRHQKIKIIRHGFGAHCNPQLLTWLREEDHNGARLGNSVTPCLKITSKKSRNIAQVRLQGQFPI